MQNPFQSSAANNINDPLAFVKKLWGDMQLPGMVTPTLSVDELDKQIKDLKTVESWLNVNMNMLKGTIQALEVQRATISALKTMGESFAQATTKSEPGSSVDESTANWPMHVSHKAGSGAKTSAIKEPSVEENEEETEDDDAESPPEDIKAAAKRETTATAEPLAADKSSMHNPAAWWTVLQDQFKQALHHAMKDEAQQTPDASAPVAPKSAAKPTKKTAVKAAPASRQRVTKAAAASTPKTKVAVMKPKSATKVVAKTTTTSKSRSRA
nr:PhaM family polyhydroxyalkanoate granule multifunctional regulatory protein [uncultured Undibacterium sp.]